MFFHLLKKLLFDDIHQNLKAGGHDDALYEDWITVDEAENISELMTVLYRNRSPEYIAQTIHSVLRDGIYNLGVHEVKELIGAIEVQARKEFVYNPKTGKIDLPAP